MSYQGYGGTAVVSTDGLTIMVGSYPHASGCETIVPVARESTARVALYLKDVTRGCRGGSGGGATAPNHMAPEPVFAANIRLRQPLGDRMLVNGATGKTIAWTSSRLVLRLADTGYRLRTIEPTADISGVQEASAGATQSYSKGDGPERLFIVQSAGSIRLPGQAPGGWIPIRVRGHPGRATRNLITWQENGLTDYMQVSAQAQGDPQILTTRQLIALADSAASYASVPLPTCCPPR